MPRKRKSAPRTGRRRPAPKSTRRAGRRGPSRSGVASLQLTPTNLIAMAVGAMFGDRVYDSETVVKAIEDPKMRYGGAAFAGMWGVKQVKDPLFQSAIVGATIAASVSLGQAIAPKMAIRGIGRMTSFDVQKLRERARRRNLNRPEVMGYIGQGGRPQVMGQRLRVG